MWLDLSSVFVPKGDSFLPFQLEQGAACALWS